MSNEDQDEEIEEEEEFHEVEEEKHKASQESIGGKFSSPARQLDPQQQQSSPSTPTKQRDEQPDDSKQPQPSSDCDQLTASSQPPTTTDAPPTAAAAAAAATTTTTPTQPDAATPTTSSLETTPQHLLAEQSQPNGRLQEVQPKPVAQLDDCDEEPIAPAPAPTPTSFADNSMTVNVGDITNLNQQSLNESLVNAIDNEFQARDGDKDETDEQESPAAGVAETSMQADNEPTTLPTMNCSALSKVDADSNARVVKDVGTPSVEGPAEFSTIASTTTNDIDLIKPRLSERVELDWTDIMSPTNCQKDSSVEVEVESSSLANDLEAISDVLDDSDPRTTLTQQSIDEQQAIAAKTITLDGDAPREDSEEKADTEGAQKPDNDGETLANESAKIDEVDQKLKELDLDEDVKNPQYIPKKGGFYEHDDRSHDADEKKQPNSSGKKSTSETGEAKGPVSGVKPSTQEKSTDSRRGRRQRTEVDRWNHDLFRDEKQRPKSKSELINAYGYDIRQERGARNHDNRGSRNNNSDNKPSNSQDNQRSRLGGRDGRARDGRQNQPSNRSHDRKSRRSNNNNSTTSSSSNNQAVNNTINHNNNNTNRIASKTETTPNAIKRDGPNNNRLDAKADSRDFKQLEAANDDKNYQMASTSSSQHDRREQAPRDRNARNDLRGRRRNSRDRPNQPAADDKLPPINTVMPSITVWSQEDMKMADAMSKTSPSRNQAATTFNNSLPKNRSGDYWQTNQPNKNNIQTKPMRAPDENRHQHQQQYYNSRNRYQDREDAGKPGNQFMNRSHFNDRSNQQSHEWRRTNNFGGYGKSNEYDVIKTQTFENTRLAQANMNRQRDLREIINERRVQGQHNFPSKMRQDHSSVGVPDQQMHHQQHNQASHSPHMQPMGHQPPHQSMLQHAPQPAHQQQQQQQQHMMRQHQQTPLLLLQQQQQAPQVSTTQQHQTQPPTSQQQQHQHPTGVSPQSSQRSPPQSTQQPSQPQQAQNQHHHPARQNIVMSGGVPTDAPADAASLRADTSGTNDLLNSRPIVKTDAYTNANMASHSQPLSQHSQNHRTMSGHMSHQGPNPAGSHIVPSHINAGAAQTQYYTPSNNTRDSAAALASAYHGYMPGGPSVMDSTRYHLTSQQLSDHGYLTSPGQANDVATSVLHQQQGMYADAASAGGTVASSTYLAQTGSTLSPSSNIPVTGAGPPPPLPPVSYLQPSQYAYSNPYSQPQHNQPPPPQSSHGYPYWAPYI